MLFNDTTCRSYYSSGLGDYFGLSFSQIMVSLVNTDNLSLQFKVYLLILHTVFLGLIVHVLSAFVFTKPRTKGESGDQKSEKHYSGVRTVHVDDKRVTVESCQWINSILNWLYMNASSTPDLVKIWLTMLNEKLKTEKVSLFNNFCRI